MVDVAKSVIESADACFAIPKEWKANKANESGYYPIAKQRGTQYNNTRTKCFRQRSDYSSFPATYWVVPFSQFSVSAEKMRAENIIRYHDSYDDYRRFNDPGFGNMEWALAKPAGHGSVPHAECRLAAL
jgi:hypothetical protein